ncbi:hypothetical protein EON65_01690 [archaeon]|nr:MAG: hypothetical protein EON65_01690 [archaeon]
MELVRSLFSRSSSSSSSSTANATSDVTSSLQSTVVSDPPLVPYYYRECRTYEEKVLWAQSDYGQHILSLRPILQEHYRTGQLLRMFKNKHWAVRLEEWLTLHHEQPHSTSTSSQASSQRSAVPYGLTLPLTEDEKEKLRNDWLVPKYPNDPALLRQFAGYYEAYRSCEMELQNKLQLAEEGYTVLPGIIPYDLLQQANFALHQEVMPRVDLSFVGHKDKMDPLQRNQDPYFLSGTINHPALLALYYASPLHSIIQNLLYGNTQAPFSPSVFACQLAFRFSTPRPVLEGREQLGGLGWHIDGLERGKYGSFSLLIGVPLNEQTEPWGGNLCLHPRSHYALLPYLKAYYRVGEEEEGGPLPIKPNLGEPVQVCLQAGAGGQEVLETGASGKPGSVREFRGDVVIAFHKVAHRGGPNYSGAVRKMLYFRISHQQHADLRQASLEDPLIEFAGLSGLS